MWLEFSEMAMIPKKQRIEVRVTQKSIAKHWKCRSEAIHEDHCFGWAITKTMDSDSAADQKSSNFAWLFAVGL